MRIQGRKQGHMNIKIQGYKNARIQASIRKDGYEDARMRGYKQVHRNLRI